MAVPRRAQFRAQDHAGTDHWIPRWRCPCNLYHVFSVCSYSNVVPSKAWSPGQGPLAQIQGQYWIRSSLCCLEQPSPCCGPTQDSAVKECGRECFWTIPCFTGHRLTFEAICQRHYHGQRSPDLLQSCSAGKQAPSQAGSTASLVESWLLPEPH